MRNVFFKPGTVVMAAALVLGISTASHAIPKASFNIDLDALYGSLASSFGAPFAVGADLDGEEGPDAQQDEFLEFNAIASDVSDPDHESIHDAWIDNFLLARNAMRDNTVLSNAVIDEIASIFGVFMTVQTHEMEHAMEDLWEGTLGITDPSFSSQPWVQAEHFEGGHGHEGEEEGEHEHEGQHEGEHEGEDDHDHDHDHDHGAEGMIKYFYHIGDNLYAEIPEPIDENAPIQWYFNGVAMEDYLGLILGTQSRELELISLQPEQSGTYTATYSTGGKSNATYAFTIQVVDPEELPASQPYTLLLLVFAISVAGGVLYVRRVRA